MARAQLKKARAAAGDARGPLGQRIHVVRTVMKKVRALNRLVRPPLGRRARRADTRLRKLAHSVSSLRDAEVILKTFDEAAGPSRASLESVRARLAARLRAQSQAFEKDEHARRLGTSLARERRKVEAWMPKADLWSAVDEGLTCGYQRARAAMEAAYRSESGADFHAWRRAVKTHRHQIAVLKAIAPARMKERLTELDRLGDLLGDEHDLTVLEGAICAELPHTSDPRPSADLLRQLAERQRQLRRRAQPLGKRLFTERTAAFRERMRKDFCAFRS